VTAPFDGETARRIGAIIREEGLADR
jgi:hypothetical protein